uniref:Uncharacterized protein n=1 Tax=Chromera velia CCMP2878 TaxID=1169474 RepID=A0A0G4G831_9ALVE|eukprot:Cvel_20734.t1-p1 / transcript=Cvel_20734.t1 / gene=Cvel_20734 / organism=Chromera_velia_CCMP2878 / gene_product=hypothetical protein / transcript_product=hypothetical protein / location=Cvel_scaffold1888:17671-21263(+) / protein_length=344 / sequence_SO=supercontig / SO=protein_coding / is_pseudo=false
MPKLRAPSPPSHPSPAARPAQITLQLYTLLVVDWDDTLLPTTWLKDEVAASLRLQGMQELIRHFDECKERGEAALSDEHGELLEKVDGAASKLIKGISGQLDKVRVVVVTNSTGNWVMESGSRFLPSTLQTLQSCGLQVMYPREMFGSFQAPVGVELNLKVPAFVHAMQCYLSDALTDPYRWADAADGVFLNVIGVGDQKGDTDALVLGEKIFNNTLPAPCQRMWPGWITTTRTKAVRFKESPQAEYLEKELVCLHKRFANETFILDINNRDDRIETWVEEDGQEETARGEETKSDEDLPLTLERRDRHDTHGSHKKSKGLKKRKQPQGESLSTTDAGQADTHQ